ncbi:uracil-DNA glycosylase family protein [Parasedimentitalea maritima]|uniref:Uracil-DNA glycosylase family protein n=1 Tax=Parasedimentitalea maritima TaxID=2578117 RepID=A0A6A4RLA2_9RHOB|nr:uracil-DNA glycosylase family protein [Zongyanglinia marina]KAE9630496.1 uracil-DNA glycosylase family protein [Zongyanglinia marina]
MENLGALKREIRACQLCADRFAMTATGHSPRPIVWFRSSARLLIAGQAPGARVQQTGRPFTDASGDRLREWLGISDTEFYDKDRVAVVPMGFCFPGYNAKGVDLPPPALCRRTWHERVFQHLPQVSLTVLVGAHALHYHLGGKTPVNDLVRSWRDHAPQVFPLPHPSWRNTGWLKKNPWFESELVPELQARVKEVLR